jgi:phosphotriesterase-related protein
MREGESVPPRRSSAVPGKVVQTVLGPIPAGDLGVTMAHEHVLVDQGHVSFRKPDNARDAHLADRPVSLDFFGWIQWNWMSNHDNLILDSESLAVDELRLYKAAGGQSLVDCTLPGIGRNPEALARIARATGLNIVMGAGYYVQPTFPERVASMSEDEITAEIIKEFREGVGDTGIRAGSIGEIGSSVPITADETKVFRAAGRAQAELKCGLTTHPARVRESPFQIIDILREVGADLTRVVLGHIDRTVPDIDGLKELAAAGCFIQYDLFGTEVTATFPYQFYGIDMPSDAQRLDRIAALVDAGHGDQVLVAHDVSTKHRTRRYGGLGYDHFLRDIVPWMPKRGFDERVIRKLIVENPRRAFAIDPC